MPKPDKTKIDQLGFYSISLQHTVESAMFHYFEELPEEVKVLVDTEGKKNIYIQHNQTPAFLTKSEELKAKGVIFTDILTAIREHGDLVQKYFMTEAVKVDEHRLTAFMQLYVNGGVFLYVPKNVEVEEPIQAIYLHDDADASLFNHVISSCR